MVVGTAGRRRLEFPTEIAPCYCAPKVVTILLLKMRLEHFRVNAFYLFKVILFKCDWVYVTKGRRSNEDDMVFTLVNFTHSTDSGD